MSEKPDFATMTAPQLRTYVLEHRDDEAALQAFLDRRYVEYPSSRVYKAEDNVADAITDYLSSKKQ
jgi:hypothetical protein